jgi:hypothetical protein
MAPVAGNTQVAGPRWEHAPPLGGSPQRGDRRPACGRRSSLPPTRSTGSRERSTALRRSLCKSGRLLVQRRNGQTVRLGVTGDDQQPDRLDQQGRPARVLGCPAMTRRQQLVLLAIIVGATGARATASITAGRLSAWPRLRHHAAPLRRAASLTSSCPRPRWSGGRSRRCTTDRAGLSGDGAARRSLRAGGPRAAPCRSRRPGHGPRSAGQDRPGSPRGPPGLRQVS